MKIVVNGEVRDVSGGMTVRELIVELRLDRGACAAEVNSRLVPRAEHESRRLEEGDRVELVSLVGGG